MLGRRLPQLLLAGVLALALAACAAPVQPSPSPTPSPSAVPQPTPEPTPEPTPAYTNPLTGLPTQSDLSGQKPVAIMLNTLSQAMPQQGNSQADILYEALAEGGITRMLGVYQDPAQLGTVGAVRSARQYYWDLALGHDAVYIHAGGSPEFYDNKASWGATTVDGVNGTYSSASAGLFWRDRERVPGHYYGYEHSLVTSGQAITTVLTQDGLLGPHREGYRYQMTFLPDATPQNGQAASVITVPFSNYKETLFRYNADTAQYGVEAFGGPFVDGNTGAQVSVTNVLILQTAYTVVDDYGRLQTTLSGGSGWYACGGQMVPIRWEKGERSAQLRYFDQAGNPLCLGQGRSYVCLMPSSRTITAQ